MKLKPSVQAYLLLSPALITVVLALVVCLGVMLVLSLWTQSYLDISATWTLDNYQQIVEKPLFLKLLLRSAAISAIVTLVSVALAYPMAYFIAFDVHDRKLTWLIFLTLPFWISYLLRILSWKLILGFNGVINTALIESDMVTEPLSFLLYNPTAIVVALVHAWAPFALLPIYVSLEKVDRALIAASSDLGDSPFWTFLRVTLPLSMPGVTAAALLIFIPTFGDYITPALVGGPSGAMIGTFITMQFGASNNWPLGSAVSIASMLIATLIACLALGGTRKALQWAN
jgi:spermidine/putrescine transport system permease protein